MNWLRSGLFCRARKPYSATRVGRRGWVFAVLLKFFQAEGCFPRHSQEVVGAAVEYLSRQIGVPAAEWIRYDCDSRAAKYHRTRKFVTCLGSARLPSKMARREGSAHHDAMMLLMRTTLNLPDDVYRIAQSVAVARGISLGNALAELVRQGLNPPLRAGLKKKAFPCFDVPEDAAPITLEDTLKAEDRL
jgi:uncharacterized protein DUF4158